MDDFPATQLCESSKSFSELSQTQTPDGDKKKQVRNMNYLHVIVNNFLLVSIFLLYSN